MVTLVQFLTQVTDMGPQYKLEVKDRLPFGSSLTVLPYESEKERRW
jgi:hypothetical protein